MEFKNFIKGTFKVSIAIFTACIGLALVAWVVTTVRDIIEKKDAQQYEVVRNWSLNIKDPLQMKLLAKTKIVDGRLYASIDLNGYPAYLSDPIMFAKNKNAQFMVIFEDRDGFQVYQKDIKVSEFSSIVGDNDKKSGLSYQFNEYLGADTYKNFATINLHWTLDTTAPEQRKPLASANIVPKPTGLPDTDPCAPGLSKSDRLKRLATHGTIRQTGQETYTAGGREVAFFSEGIGGGLLGCR
jgi:hypothetical protein